MSRLSRDTWLSYAWLTQAGVQWAERDPISLLAGASPTNGSPGLPLPLPYIYIYIYILIMKAEQKRAQPCCHVTLFCFRRLIVDQWPTPKISYGASGDFTPLLPLHRHPPPPRPHRASCLRAPALRDPTPPPLAGFRCRWQTLSPPLQTLHHHRHTIVAVIAPPEVLEVAAATTRPI
jgi:hypothetical protein